MSVPGVTFHRREVWQNPALPVSGPPMMWTRIDTTPLHYTAADDLIDGDPGEHAEDLPAYLRAIQRDYKRRGYSVGYNFAVDWLGGVWELRGFDFKCAANRGWNGRTVAVLCLVDGADPLTAEALEAVRKIIAETDRRAGRVTNVVPHSAIGATQCCGDGIRGQISAGLVTPWKEPTMRGIPETIIFDSKTDLGRSLNDHEVYEVEVPGHLKQFTWLMLRASNIPDGETVGHLRVAGDVGQLEDANGLTNTQNGAVNDLVCVRPVDGTVVVQPRFCSPNVRVAVVLVQEGD